MLILMFVSQTDLRVLAGLAFGKTQPMTEDEYNCMQELVDSGIFDDDSPRFLWNEFF